MLVHVDAGIEPVDDADVETGNSILRHLPKARITAMENGLGHGKVIAPFWVADQEPLQPRLGLEREALRGRPERVPDESDEPPDATHLSGQFVVLGEHIDAGIIEIVERLDPRLRYARAKGVGQEATARSEDSLEAGPLYGLDER